MMCCCFSRFVCLVSVFNSVFCFSVFLFFSFSVFLLFLEWLLWLFIAGCSRWVLSRWCNTSSCCCSEEDAVIHRQQFVYKARHRAQRTHIHEETGKWIDQVPDEPLLWRSVCKLTVETWRPRLTLGPRKEQAAPRSDVIKTDREGPTGGATCMGARTK